MPNLNLRQSYVSHDPSEIILICWFAVPEQIRFCYWI